MNFEKQIQTQHTHSMTSPFEANNKWSDPFIDELHQVRARLLAKANGDMHQLILNAHQTSVKHGFAVR